MDIFEFEYRKISMPALVSIDEDGGLMVPMISNATDKPTIPYPRNHIGHTWDELIEMKFIPTLEFEAQQVGKHMVIPYEYKGKQLHIHPEDIATTILASVKKFAERRLKRSIKNVAISVPPDYTNSQRAALREAAYKAGLHVLRLPSEAVSAARSHLFYSEGREDGERKILVFDLGGHSFHATILSLENGNYHELMSTFANIGGRDFTQSILNYFQREITEQAGIDAESYTQISKQFFDIANTAKETLTNYRQTSIKFEDDANGIGFASMLRRHKFEDLNKELFDKLMDTVNKAIEYSPTKSMKFPRRNPPATTGAQAIRISTCLHRRLEHVGIGSRETPPRF
jgi:molecular chaperone DnaK (HSP70)